MLPGLRELVVEPSIRKLAIHHSQSVESVTDQYGRLVGARFRLGEVLRDLKILRHTYSWHEIREAILVGSGAIVTIRRESDRRVLVRAPIFPIVSLPGEAADGSAYVAFHPMVTAGIADAEYRQADYNASMQLRSSVARWLHRRMIHRYRQADLVGGDPYTIRASTIIAESGAVGYRRLREKLAAVDDAVQELRDRHVVSVRRADIVAPSRSGAAVVVGRAWQDTKLVLFGSSSFVTDTKIANRAERDRKGAVVEVRVAVTRSGADSR